MNTIKELNRKMKEFTFQAINSYYAETEEEAWQQLQDDIQNNIKAVFEVVSEVEGEE